ncbi:amidohydrolase family protein [Mycena albidolilacea]|uniref:Amidohydrolase family protein n=1 Tax=Mycena albidolilacea TaxID=1033008 RepID=A0AAD6YYC2_9AGAR|nr:amidohydrolase family protein [Mycena albidolilacea]
MFSSLFAILCLICQARSATLLRGGTFITYSESTSNLEIITDGAMLFNDTIIAISGTIDGLDSHSSDTDMQTVNTTGKIISPGFIDTHRHTWQTAMRTLGPNVQLENYGWLFGATGPAPLILSPDDIYIASLMGTLEALNAGVTTSLDFAHMTWTRAHSDAALHGVIDSGARVWWCYNVGSVVISGDPYTVNTSAPIDQLAHIRELAPDSPFNNGLVTLGIAANNVTAEIIETAQNLSINVVTTHYVGGPFPGNPSGINQVNGLTPDQGPTLNSSLAFVFAHASAINPTEARLLRQFNQYVSITPESEMHYGHGHRSSYLIQDQAALGVDTHFTFSIDMIGQMRIWLQSTRLGLYQETLDRFKIPSNTPMTVRQAFLLGTRNGGLALKQPDLGVLRVGAKADVLVFSTDAIGLVGWSDPVAAIVLHSNVADIEDIYVDGQLVKKGGKLVVDWQGEGFADRLRESGIKFRDALARTNITPFEVGLKGSLTDQDFQDPFQVDVTRGDGTGF